MKKISLMSILLVMQSYGNDVSNYAQYKGLCSEFWDLDKPKPPVKEYTFFREYVAKTKGPILEPMCGTGRYLIPLLEEGFKVDGVDASGSMLKELRAKCAQKNLSPQVWEQFLEAMPDTKKYKLIFIPDTSLCSFQDKDHIKKSLQKMYDLLLPGGTFVFDLQTTYSLADHIGLWSGKAYKRPDGNIIIESILPLPVQNSVAPLILRYELMNSTELLKTEMEYCPLKLYKVGEMDQLLKEVGFKKIKCIKAHDRKQTPSPTDLTIVYECIK